MENEMQRFSILSVHSVELQLMYLLNNYFL